MPASGPKRRIPLSSSDASREREAQVARGDIGRANARGEHRAADTSSDFVDARHRYKEALSLYEKTQDVQGQIDTLLKLGEAEYDANNFDAARRHYKKALALSKEADEPQEAHAFMGLGDVEDAAGNSNQASRYFEKALERCSDDLSVFEDEEDTEGQADTLQLMGDLEARLENIEGAHKRYKAALSLWKQEADVLGQAETLLKLGELEMEDEEGDLDEALKHYERALSFFEEKEDLQGQAEALLKLGELEMEDEEGDLDEARNCYLEALSRYTKAKDAQGEAETFMKLGALEGEAGNPDDARGHYENALFIFQAIRDLQGQADALRELGDLGGPSKPSAAPRPKAKAATRPAGSTIFICYAHADNDGPDRSSRWLDRLKVSLAPLAQKGLLAWSDNRIEVGQEWHEQIQDKLRQAKAAVLLVSPAFLGSDYIRKHELTQLLHRQAQGQLRIIPLLLRPAFIDIDFKYPHPETGPHSLRLSDLQFANGPDQALNGLDENAQDKLLLDVAKTLFRIVDEND